MSLILIQHEETGRTLEIADGQPIPEGWFRCQDPKRLLTADEIVTAVIDDVKNNSRTRGALIEVMLDAV